MFRSTGMKGKASFLLALFSCGMFLILYNPMNIQAGSWQWDNANWRWTYRSDAAPRNSTANQSGSSTNDPNKKDPSMLDQNIWKWDNATRQWIDTSGQWKWDNASWKWIDTKQTNNTSTDPNKKDPSNLDQNIWKWDNATRQWIDTSGQWKWDNASWKWIDTKQTPNKTIQPVTTNPPQSNKTKPPQEISPGYNPGNGQSGSYAVNGLASKKQQIISAGGDSIALAVAMLETDSMNTSYTFGDGKSNGSACFGVYKQNWDMIKNVQYPGATDYKTGRALNNDLKLDTQVLMKSRQKYGDQWWAGQRAGASGLNGSWSQSDINNYKNAVLWIARQLENTPKYKTDDTRFWVKVPAV